MFYSVLNKPYISFDQYLNTDKFDLIIDNIILGIAKSNSLAGPSHPGPNYLDRSKKSIFEIYNLILNDPSHSYNELISKLKIREALLFIQYKWPSHILGRCITLRHYKSYSLKHRAAECKNTPAIENFTSFMEWLKEENIFEEIGRTIIFLNDSNSFPIEHSDIINREADQKDQFIWINPLSNKKFYIKNESKKIYLESRFCYFDNANVHGADPVDYSTFSIKIDGIFSKSFLNKTGLKNHLINKENE
jgi:hypothetical protein